MLESGLTYVLLNLRMFGKLKVKLRPIDWHFETFFGFGRRYPNILHEP